MLVLLSRQLCTASTLIVFVVAPLLTPPSCRIRPRHGRRILVSRFALLTLAGPSFLNLPSRWSQALCDLFALFTPLLSGICAGCCASRPPPSLLPGLVVVVVVVVQAKLLDPRVLSRLRVLLLIAFISKFCRSSDADPRALPSIAVILLCLDLSLPSNARFCLVVAMILLPSSLIRRCRFTLWTNPHPNSTLVVLQSPSC